MCGWKASFSTPRCVVWLSFSQAGTLLARLSSALREGVLELFREVGRVGESTFSTL